MSAVLEKKLGEVAQSNQENARAIQALGKTLSTVVDKLAKQRDPGHPDPSRAFGVPYIRHGEDSMSSRGFSFLKMIGLISGAIDDRNQAKVEVDIHNRLHNCFVKELGSQGYEYKGNGLRFLAPLATSYMQDSVVPRGFRQEMKALVNAGSDGADYDEMRWMRTKQLQSMGYGKKALSWLNETTGGALVAPPEMGELIELLRNKEALVNAGARVVPLPPQGRLKYPTQTSASNTYWVGESFPIQESIIGTGEVTLQAKKLAVLIKAPNELIRFASPAAEALLRDDMTKSLALGLDLAGLQGSGTDFMPRGLINMPNINRITPTLPSTGDTGNGYKVQGVDIYRMIAAVEESDAEFETFIMRPKTLYKYYQLRADAVTAGDSAGPFLFNLIREAQDDTPATLAGYPVVKSTQISQQLVRGTSSNLTYVVGGMFSDLLIGMFGAIEFAATTQGDTAFVADQSWIRGILSADIQARHQVAFSLLQFLDTTL